MQTPSNSDRFRQILILAMLLLAIAVVIFAYLSYRSRQTASPAQEFEAKIKDTPAIPSEPEIVTTYFGQIKRLDQENKLLTLVTLYGEKQAQFDQGTIVRQLSRSTENLGPPPLEPKEEDLFLKNVIQLSLADLTEGQMVQVSSLTNIRGISKFRVDGITIIK